VVGHRTRDRKVASSTPGRDAIKSTRSTQPSIPPGYVNRVPACMAGVRRGAFTCVGWQVTLCDPIWQVASRSPEVEELSYIGLFLPLDHINTINLTVIALMSDSCPVNVCLHMPSRMSHICSNIKQRK